jgi:hypothetical protein
VHHREESRIDASERASAVILGHPDITVACRITNFSKSGICIIVQDQIPHGRTVKVDWDGHFLVGRVQRVRRSGPGYSVGLQLLNCSQWQSEPEPVVG